MTQPLPNSPDQVPPPPRDMAAALALLKRNRFRPGTVIDVGVAYGTPPLYAAFPDAYFVLFEAIAEFEPHVRAIVDRVRGEYHLCALSDEAGTASIYVTPQADGASLMHQDVKATDARLRAVPVRTLDEFFDGRDVAGPVLLKTDCQGADLRVVQGGRRFLARCDVVIMEVGMFNYWGPKTPDFAEVVAHLRGAGFVPYDFFDHLPRPRDGALGQIDVVFVRADGPLRTSHEWA